MTNTDKSGAQVTADALRLFVDNLKIDDVYAAYSGRKGCMCGCMGKYTYNPKYVAESAQERGYAVSGDEISLRSLLIMLGKVKKNPSVEIHMGKVLHYETETRQYAVYIRQPMA